MHKENIDKIIANGTTDQMHDLKDLFVDTIDYLKATDYTQYIHIEYELNDILYNGHLGEELAKCWVAKMENKDGSSGGHWTWEQTQQVQKDKGISCDASDFYAALNMIYSDYYNSKFDLNIYVELARDWLMDKDVGNDKALRYYFYVVKAK